VFGVQIVIFSGVLLEQICNVQPGPVFNFGSGDIMSEFPRNQPLCKKFSKESQAESLTRYNEKTFQSGHIRRKVIVRPDN
jgi:hypothetical protein